MRRPVRPARTATAVVVAAFLFVGLAGCGSSDSGGSEGASETTAAPSDSTATTEVATDEGDSGGEVDCAADQEAGIEAESLSRSTVVLFSADANSGVSDADITADTTMTLQDDGTLAPSTLEVAVGQVFGIAPADGGNVDAVKIGCADAQTLLPGSPAGFVITQPGTYAISLEIAGTELGTVTVS